MSATNPEAQTFDPFLEEDVEDYEDEGVADLAASLGPSGDPAGPPDADDGFEDVSVAFEEDGDFDGYDDVLDEASAIDALSSLVASESDEDDYGDLDDGEDDDAPVVAAATRTAVEPYQDAADANFDIVAEDTRIVPRIAIHAFCEENETSETLERAAGDRRLRKTHMTIQMGGLDAAIEHYQDAATPNLLMVETSARGEQLMARLGELAQVCDPSTKVVVVGYVNDISLYRQLIREGVSEYLVQPRAPLQLIRLIADLYVDPESAPKGKTYAFIGSRGGVGSSTIAHNVAWCAAEQFEAESILVDLDLSFGTASLDFEQETSSGLIDALTSPERLDDVLLERLLVKCTENLRLFAAQTALDRDDEIDDQAFETVIDVVQGSAGAIFLDLPHAWTSWKKRVLAAADQIVICATPDLASFRNTKSIVEQLKPIRSNDADPILVINQTDVPKRPEIPEDQFEESIGLKPSAVIPWDPGVFGVAATSAIPVFEAAAKSKPAQVLRDLTGEIVGRPPAKKKRSLLSSLLGR